MVSNTIKVELGVVIGKAGSNIKEADAFKYVAGYALALDLTARDVQVRKSCDLTCLFITPSGKGKERRTSLESSKRLRYILSGQVRVLLIY